MPHCAEQARPQRVATRLLRDGLTTFDLAWSDLLGRIVAKRHELAPGRG